MQLEKNLSFDPHASGKISVATQTQLRKILILTHMQFGKSQLRSTCNWEYLSCNPHANEKITVATQMQLKRS
jgi:hypothetical protein